MGKERHFFNFQYLETCIERGGFFKKGDSWGILSNEETNLDFNCKVVIGVGNPFTQHDGLTGMPESLTPTPPTESGDEGTNQNKTDQYPNP